MLLCTAVATVGLSSVEPQPASAAVATFAVDTSSPLGPVNRRVAGVVMNYNVSASTPLSRGTDINLRSGRYATYPRNWANQNMPRCWTGDPTDYAIIDREIGQAIALGMDPVQLELQLIFISPCDVAPAPVGTTLSMAQLMSISALAIHTNPTAVQKMLHDQIDHLVAKFGMREFAAWNEPEVTFPITPVTYHEFYRLVDNALRAVESERTVDLHLAGPETAVPQPTVAAFLDFVGQNHLDLDRLTFHAYANTGTEPTPIIYARQIGNMRQYLADAQAKYPWLQPELVADEWGFDPTARNESDRDGSGTAMIASGLTTFLDQGIAGAMYFGWQDLKGCPSGCQASDLHFGLLDVDDNPRPTWQAFRMFANLGDTRLTATPSSSQVSGRQEWGGLATKAADGTVRILFHNWDPAKTGASVDVALALAGFTPASWTAETVTLANPAVAATSGTGTPPVTLPANSTMLLVLHP
jgi:hypothetical protein